MKKSKLESLRQDNVLNPNPGKVVEPLFGESPFFDKNDLVQVKYEMLRQHLQDKEPVSKASKAFGFSRVTFYESKQMFEQEGILGLVPKARGPKSGYKLSSEMVDFALERMKLNPKLKIEELLQILENHYHVSVHKRTLERALARKKKAPR
jgi:transposase